MERKGLCPEGGRFFSGNFFGGVKNTKPGILGGGEISKNVQMNRRIRGTSRVKAPPMLDYDGGHVLASHVSRVRPRTSREVSSTLERAHMQSGAADIPRCFSEGAPLDSQSESSPQTDLVEDFQSGSARGRGAARSKTKGSDARGVQGYALYHPQPSSIRFLLPKAQPSPSHLPHQYLFRAENPHPCGASSLGVSAHLCCWSW